LLREFPEPTLKSEPEPLVETFLGSINYSSSGSLDGSCGDVFSWRGKHFLAWKRHGRVHFWNSISLFLLPNDSTSKTKQ